MKKPNLHQFELSNLANKTLDRDDIIKDKTLSEGFKKVIPVDKIDNSIQKIVSPSDVAEKVAKFRAGRAAQRLAGSVGAVSKALNNPIAKKLALGALGPIGMALGTAQDVMASDDANVGADEPYLKEEALIEQPYENFADHDVSEQARRYQKIKAMLGRE